MSKMLWPRSGWEACSVMISGPFQALTLGTTGPSPSTPYPQERPKWHPRPEVPFVLVVDAGWMSLPMTHK
eukprot:10777948-Karenia_brevis.AAC.1